ncbi:MAG: DUF1533 domain-containing protein, partial [Clostridiales bacterium]|nr:DUF1533 domain-containing protein [Clostridiales bacterium]
SVWREQDDLQEDCTWLQLSASEIYLDGVFASARTVAAFADGNETPQWSIAPQGVATLETDESGYAARLTAARAGDATVTVTCGNKSATVAIHVGAGSFAGNVTASAETVLSGGWNITADGALRCNASGDADILMNERADDFAYTARFALTDGQAAALTFRAESDLSAYYKANYDHVQKAVKLWTRDKVTGRVRELANVPYTAPDPQNITLSVRALGYAIRVSVNGREVIYVNDYDVNAPRNGLFGLNAFNGETRFMQVSWESMFKAASNTITADMPFVVTVGAKKPQNITLNGTALAEDQYRIASGQLFINAGVAKQGENVLTFTVDGAEQRFAFTVTASTTVAPAKQGGGLAGWAIALIVIACVLVAGGGAFCAYWFLLRGKRSTGKTAAAQDTPAENTENKKEENEDGGEH